MKSKNKKVQSMLSLLLAVVLILGNAVPTMAFPKATIVETESETKGLINELDLSQEVLSVENDEVKEFLDQYDLETLESIDFLNETMQKGLVGFEDEYELLDDETPVSVMVLFNNEPAETNRVQKALENNLFMTASEAEDLAMQDHDIFQKGMDEIFPKKSTYAMPDYSIDFVYTKSLNGVAVTLPSSKVKEMADIESVYTVIPNKTVYLDPVVAEPEISPLGSLEGNKDGRVQMNVPELHELGITGEGTTVCIIDSGIDYMHPDFEGSFLTESPSGNSDELIDGNFYGRNFIETTYGIMRDDNDPRETTYEEWKKSSHPEISIETKDKFYTSHGTHVSGSVAARGMNNPDDPDATSALGVAPDAKIYVYRVFGPYSEATGVSVSSAIEYTAIDKPDVVNMSLGSRENSIYAINVMGVNNVMLANPDILFVLASGNAGSVMYTVGSPAASPLGLTVGNASVAERSLEVKVKANEIELPLFRLFDKSNSAFTENTETGSFALTGTGLIPVTEEPSYKIVALPNISKIEDADDDLGTGTREEFEAVKDQISGNVVAIRRGSEFLKSIELAKEYGAGAIILVNRKDDDGESISTIIEVAKDLLPFYTILDYSKGKEFLQEAKNNNDSFTFSTVVEVNLPIMMNGSSSNGPVKMTYDIKPDVISHGTRVLSTYPLVGIPSEVTYDDAYSVLNGTSMASPHVAGAAALLRQYSKNVVGGNGWSANEMKMRLANTAQISPINYSVYQTGNGFVDVKAAIDAKGYVEIEAKGRASIGTSILYDTVSPSFNFGFIDVISEDVEVKVLMATIHNGSNEDITYVPTYSFTGTDYHPEFVKDAAALGLTLSFGEDSITVPAGGSKELSVTLTVPANIGTKYAGSFEGRITLTNVENTAETFVMAFAAIGRDMEPIFKDESDIFFDRPVVSTGANAQIEESSTNDFYYRAQDTASYTFYLLDAEKVAENPIDFGTNDSSWSSIDGIITGLLPTYYSFKPAADGGYKFIEDVVTAQYREVFYIDGESFVSSEFTTLKEGKHVVLVSATNEDNYVTFYTLPLYVDNTLPEFNISGLMEGEYKSVSVNDGADSVTLTGNIYDEGLEQMKDDGVKFPIWEPGDYLSPEITRKYNALFIGIEGSYYHADVDPDTGDYTVTVPLNGRELPIKADYYVLDEFSVRNRSGSENFNPEEPSMSSLIGSSQYGMVGSNMTTSSFYFEDEGFNMLIEKTEYAILGDENIFIVPKFNQLALNAGDRIVYANADDPSVVNVTRIGNEINIFGLSVGETDVTIRSKTGIEKIVHVTVSRPISAGIDLRTGDYVYYGATDHISAHQTNNTDNNVYEGIVTPILWKIMGEEVFEGVRDGHLTLMSEYVLDAREMALIGGYKVNESIETLRHFLNGGTYEGSSGEVRVESEFIKNFQAAEQTALIRSDNAVPRYSTDGKLMPAYSNNALDEWFFLPWLHFNYSTLVDRQWSVYWSKGQDREPTNTIIDALPRAEMVGNQDLIATFKNGRDAEYWTETLLSQHYIHVVENSEINPINENGKRPSSIRGVRPLTKISPESIVYAYEITDVEGLGNLSPDGLNYQQTSPGDEGRAFKLTVLGGNQGQDVGKITGDIEVMDESTSFLGGNLVIPAALEGDSDLIAYKIIDQDRELVLYGETSLVDGELVIETEDLFVGEYDVFVWPQKNNEIYSHEAGVMNRFSLFVLEDEIESVTFDGETELSRTMEQNEVDKLYAQINPISASSIGVVWSSSDNLVVSVGVDGTIIANDIGTADIFATAKSNSEIFAVCHITVEAEKVLVENITLDLNDIALEGEEEETIVATVTPSDASNLSVIFVSTNEEVASVDEYGKITAVSEGVAFVYARALDGSACFAAAKVVVNNAEFIEAALLEIDQSNIEINLSYAKEAIITATVSPEDAHNSTLLWSSSDIKVASVNDEGLVIGHRLGETVITVKTVDGSLTETCFVTVTRDYSLESIRISRKNHNIYLNEEETVFATIKPDSEEPIQLIWSSSDETVASLAFAELISSEENTVTAVGAGTSVITVQTVDGIFKSSYVLTVLEEHDDFAISGPDVDVENQSLHVDMVGLVGHSIQLEVISSGVKMPASDFIWTSFNAPIVSVDETGTLMFHKTVGTTAVIRAKLKADPKKVALLHVKGTEPVSDFSFIDANGNDITDGTLIAYAPFSYGHPVYVKVKYENVPTKASLTWTSSDSEKVRLGGMTDNEVNISPFDIGDVIITATTNDGSNISRSFTVESRQAPTKVTFENISPAYVGVGAEIQLIPVLEAPTPIAEEAKVLKYSSSNESVATVDDDGLIKAVGYGSATVSATSITGDRIGNFTINVIDYNKVIVDLEKPAQITVLKGTSFSSVGLPSKVTAYLQDGTKCQVTAWWLEGEYNQDAPGTYTIYATIYDLPKGVTNLNNLSTSMKIKVIMPTAVESVSLSQNFANITLDETITLSATINPVDATNKGISWSSDDEGIATVQNGVVTPVSVGQTTITVTTLDGGKTDTCLVTVTEPIYAVESIELSEETLRMIVDTEETLTYTITPANATNKSVTWSSSDETVATVLDGKITAIAAGETTITVTTVDGGFTDSCLVTVPDGKEMSVIAENGKITIRFASDFMGSPVLEDFIISSTGTEQEINYYGYSYDSSTKTATVLFNKVLRDLTDQTVEISIEYADFSESDSFLVAELPWATAISFEKSMITTVRNRKVELLVKVDIEVVEDGERPYTITYTSSNPSIVVVDEFGVITTKAKGMAFITATIETKDGIAEAKMVVRVN